MTTVSWRLSLERACEEIEGVCKRVPIAEPQKERLEGIKRQLRYHVDGNWEDPEASVYPDPGVLETISDRLTKITVDTEGDAEVRLSRARDEVLLAIAALTDDIDKQRQLRKRIR